MNIQLDLIKILNFSQDVSKMKQLNEKRIISTYEKYTKFDKPKPM